MEAYQKSEGGRGMQGRTPRSLEITRAMEGCKSGDTANAIPTMERYLRYRKVALPAR